MKRKRALERERPEVSPETLAQPSAPRPGVFGFGAIVFVAVVLGVLLLSAALPRASMLEETAASMALESDGLLPIPFERDPLPAIVDGPMPCEDVSPLRDVRSRALERSPRDPCAIFDHGPRGPPQFASACI